MKTLHNVLNSIRKATSKQLFVIFALFLAVSLGGLTSASSITKTNRVSADTCAGDPSYNSIIRCGEPNRAAFIAAVRGNAEYQNIYSWAGLNPADYDRFVSSAQQGVAYASDNTIKVGGRTVATNVYSIGRWQSAQGSNPMEFSIGGHDYFGNYNNKAFRTSTTTIPVDVLFNADGTMQFAVMTGDCANPLKGTPTPPPTPPKPPATYTCNLLTVTPGNFDQQGRQAYTLTVKGSFTNATFMRYNINYGDGTAESNNNGTFTHSYAPGSRTATASMTVQTNTGAVVTTPANANCAKPITVTPSTLACIELTATPGKVNHDNGSVTYTLTAQSKASNATISNYVFNFGDKTKQVTVDSSKSTASTDHTFASGSWNAQVTVNGKNSVGQALTSTNNDCVTIVKVGKPNPNITLTKTVDGVKLKQVAVNQNFTYQLVIKNIGKLNLQKVVISDAAPAGVTLISTDLGTISNNNLEYIVPELKIGQTVTINITAVVKTYIDGSLVNTACVNAPQVNPGQPNQPDVCDTATVTVPAPPVTPPTTPVTPPATLVNTGAGSVVGIFAGSAILGTFAYRLFLGRRLNRNN